MANRTVAHYVARALWIFPALLLFLTIDQAKVALDLRETWAEGTPAMAEVMAFENTNRADVTYGYLDLRVPLPDGQVLVKEKLSLPHSLWGRVDGKEALAVHVRPGASQEVVIDVLMPGHWLIAASQSAMSLIGALILFAGVFWWNRYLRTRGDPARRRPDPEAVEA